MWSRPSCRTKKCSCCGVQLVVPLHSGRTIRCAACHAVTPRTDDPVQQAASFLKSVVTSISRGLSSFSSSYNGGGSSSSSLAYGNGYMGYSADPTAVAPLPSSFPLVHGKKRALLVGISYTSTKHELRGTVNDVNCMKFLLCERLGFPEDCILALTEEERDIYRLPTKDNIRLAMQWLVAGCQAGDSLVFHFSGHAIQRLDPSGDERDGYDEALCPLDFQSRGTIVDDEIKAVLVRPLPKGAKLHAIVDACHSGTILDLPFLCRLNKAGYYQWEDHNPLHSDIHKDTGGGLAILISGCDDHQTSADTSVLSGSNTATGAMTYSFIQALENEPGTTYGRLLMAMRSAIRDASTGNRLSGPIASLMRKVFNFGLTQEPQLSSSEMFDIYRKPFLL